jgi:hypothetical protein
LRYSSLWAARVRGDSAAEEQRRQQAAQEERRHRLEDQGERDHEQQSEERLAVEVGLRSWSGADRAARPARPARAIGRDEAAVRDSAGKAVAAGTADFDTAACASGEKATGGGVFVVAGNAIINDVPVTESDSTVNASGDPVGWEGGINNTSAGTVTLVVEAICASP